MHTAVPAPTNLPSLRKRDMDVVAHLKRVLDQLAFNLYQDPFQLFFLTSPPLTLKDHTSKINLTIPLMAAYHTCPLVGPRRPQ